MLRLLTAFISVVVPLVFAWPASAQHPRDVVKGLWTSYVRSYDAGDYAQAEAYSRRLIDFATGRFGPSHRAVSLGFHMLGQVSMRFGRTEEAEAAARRALAIREREFGPRSAPVAATLTLLGHILLLRHRHAEAEAALQRAIGIHARVKPVQPHQRGNALRVLAISYARQRRFAEAEPLYLRAIAELERAVGKTSVWTVRTTRNYATMLAQMGRMGDAETQFKRAIAGLETRTGGEHSELVQALSLFAHLLSNLDRFDEAEVIYKRALVYSQKFADQQRNLHIGVLQGLGELYIRRGQDSDAEQVIREALAQAEKRRENRDEWLAFALTQRAQTDIKARRLSDAESALRRAIDIYRSVPGRRDDLLASAHSLLGSVLALTRRSDESRAAFEEADQIALRIFGTDHPRIAMIHRTRGAALGSAGLRDDAIAALERASDVLERAARRESTSGRGAFVISEFRPQLRRSIHGELIALSWTSAAATSDPPARKQALNRAFLAAQRTSDTSTAQAVGQMSARFATEDRPLAELLRRSQDLAQRIRELDDELVQRLGVRLDDDERGAARDRASQQKELERLNAELAVLETRLHTEFPAFAELTRVAAIPVEETRSLLAGDEALINITVGARATYVWAITATDEVWHRVELPATEIDKLVETLRCGVDIAAWLDPARSQRCKSFGLMLEHQGVLPFDLSLAHRLYAALLAPLEPQLAGKRLIMVPSGALTSLPLHLLVTREPAAARPRPEGYRDAAWLIRKHAISVIPSVASLRALRLAGVAPPPPKPMIGYGAPSFPQPSGPPPAPDAKPTRTASLPPSASRTRASTARTTPVRTRAVSTEIVMGLAPLPETASELREVARRVGASSSELHLGADASETSVKRSRLDEYRIVYFATHGLVADEVGGLSEPALALTPPNAATAQDDGLLTASEVAQLKLNADWVVLSACNTAAGARPGAEALSGLARAFFYAGARALLVSHWRVYSEAALQLSAGLFSELSPQHEVGRDEALRRSILALLDRGNVDEVQPAYWAPFVLVGVGGQVTTPASPAAPSPPRRPAPSSLVPAGPHPARGLP